MLRWWTGADWSDHVISKSVGYEYRYELLHRKLQDELVTNLGAGEPVLVIIRGASNQAIVGTDRRAIVFKKGMLAGASFGTEITNWAYSHLTGVQVHTGMMTGAVILQAPANGGTRTDYWGNGDGDPFKAPNAVPIVRPYEVANAGAVRLRELVQLAQDSASSTAGTIDKGAFASSAAAVDEVRRLAELRREGLISDEEFRLLSQVAMTSRVAPTLRDP